MSSRKLVTFQRERVSVKEGPRRAKLHVVGNDVGYARPWLPLFALEDDRKKADVCLFTGGADIDPALYGEENVMSYPVKRRDDFEVDAFWEFKELGTPMIGICRGAQLITALTGGKLFQHVDGHGNGGHIMETKDGKRLQVTSAHHQMMRPSGDFEILAWHPGNRSKRHIHANGNALVNVRPDYDNDPEVIWYPKIRALCIQGHPEWMDMDSPTNIWFRSLAKQLLLSKEYA